MAGAVAKNIAGRSDQDHLLSFLGELVEHLGKKFPSRRIQPGKGLIQDQQIVIREQGFHNLQSFIFAIG